VQSMRIEDAIEQKGLTNFLKELCANIHQLQKEHPDAVYRPVEDVCSYTEGYIYSNGQNRSGGCIIGQALQKMGVDVTYLTGAFNAVMSNYAKNPEEYKITSRLTDIQSNQDDGWSWGQCGIISDIIK